MVTVEWSQFCNKLTISDVIKVLHRFSSHFGRIINNYELVRKKNLLRFLENRVIPDLLKGKKLHGDERINIKAILDQLHERILVLNGSSVIKPKDISLALNSYAKCYNSIEFNVVSDNQSLNRKVLINYVHQLLPVANKLLPYMNEQDLSLVLNCISKLNIRDSELIETANSVLYSQLTSYYRLIKNNEGTHDNLFLNITPQGVSLILNCFAKLNVSLNKGVLLFFSHKYVPDNMDKFLINQLIVVLHSFFKLKVSANEIYKIIGYADAELSKKREEYNMKLISTALYTFSKYSYFPVESIGVIVEFFDRNDFKKNSELEISNLYYALGKLHIRNKELINKLNTMVIRNIKIFTTHGIVNVYYSLSKLNYKCDINDKHGSSSIYDLLITEFLNRLGVGQLVDLMVLPLHIINVCFGSILNYIIDHSLYNHLFAKLNSMVHTGIPCGDNSSNILLKFREDVSFDKDPLTNFIINHIGTQGIYQTYCICQHIMHYVDSGLDSLSLNVLIALDQLFENWQCIIDTNAYNTLNEDLIMIDKAETDDTVVTPNLTTSRIHDSVYTIVQDIVNNDQNDRAKDSIKPNNKTLVYKEHEAIPYTIDIVLYKMKD